MKRSAKGFRSGFPPPLAIQPAHSKRYWTYGELRATVVRAFGPVLGLILLHSANRNRLATPKREVPQRTYDVWAKLGGLQRLSPADGLISCVSQKRDEARTRHRRFDRASAGMRGKSAQPGSSRICE